MSYPTVLFLCEIQKYTEAGSLRKTGWKKKANVLLGIVEHHKIIGSNGAIVLTMCACCVQVTDHGVLLMELGSGLSFPATEYISHIIHTQALQGKDLFVFV